MNIYSDIGRQILNMLWPTLCPVCMDNRIFDKPLCVNCTKKLTPVPRILLQKVQEEVQAEEGNPLFIAFLFNNVIQKILHLIKYENFRALAFFIGEETGKMLKLNQLYLFDAIIPIPIHRKRLRERGFNQAELIAQGIGKQLGIPVLNNVIVRERYTASQTKLNKNNRKKNVKNAFKINDDVSLSGKNVLLLDDVITTGATINECARTLTMTEVKSLLKIAVATPLY